MSRDTIDIVRRAFVANRSGVSDETIEELLSLVDPEVDFRSRVVAVEGGDYHGHDGIRRYLADMADAFGEWRNEPGEMIEVAPGAVLVDNTFHGIGKGSGVEIELRSAMVFLLKAGKIIRCLSYPTREEALAAAGVTPSS